jgi:hypothetical protein
MLGVRGRLGGVKYRKYRRSRGVCIGGFFAVALFPPVLRGSVCIRVSPRRRGSSLGSRLRGRPSGRARWGTSAEAALAKAWVVVTLELRRLPNWAPAFAGVVWGGAALDLLSLHNWACILGPLPSPGGARLETVPSLACPHPPIARAMGPSLSPRGERVEQSSSPALRESVRVMRRLRRRGLPSFPRRPCRCARGSAFRGGRRFRGCP